MLGKRISAFSVALQEKKSVSGKKKKEGLLMQSLRKNCRLSVGIAIRKANRIFVCR